MTTTTATPTLDSTQTTSERLAQILRDADAPLTNAEIEARLEPTKLKKGELQELLQPLLDTNQVHRASKAGRQERFWGHDEVQKTRERVHARIMEFVAAGQRSMTEIVNAVKVAVSGTKDKGIKDEIASLREQKRLHDHPGKKMGAEPPDPLASLALSKAAVTSLTTAFEKAQRGGASLEQFLKWVGNVMLSASTAPRTLPDTAAPTDSMEASQPQTAAPQAAPTAAPAGSEDHELEDLVLKAVGEAGQGVPVPVADLRRQMPAEYRDTGRLDQVVWRLVQQDRLSVARHDYPASLTEEERAGLLTDNQGIVYASVVQRG